MFERGGCYEVPALVFEMRERLRPVEEEKGEENKEEEGTTAWRADFAPQDLCRQKKGKKKTIRCVSGLHVLALFCLLLLLLLLLLFLSLRLSFSLPVLFGQRCAEGCDLRKSRLSELAGREDFFCLQKKRGRRPGGKQKKPRRA